VTAGGARGGLSGRRARANGTPAPKAAYSTPAGPVAVAAGDLNRDGRADLLTANTSGSVSVLLNRGTGSFGPRTDYAAGGAPNSVTLADFDADGFLDAAVPSAPARHGPPLTVLPGH